MRPLEEVVAHALAGHRAIILGDSFEYSSITSEQPQYAIWDDTEKERREVVQIDYDTGRGTYPVQHWRMLPVVWYTVHRDPPFDGWEHPEGACR